jgi:hypothetical protein
MLPLRMRSRLPTVTFVMFGLSLAGCADRLPDQDLRILQAVPVAKLSTEILWTEYQADRRAADRKYWGKAIDVSGRLSSFAPPPAARVIFLPQPESAAGIEARLLDERSAAILTDVAAGQRITLRCFCEGLATNVVLKSCIKP